MIECRDVSFSYEPERKALDGVTFRVKPGEAVGLIGANGAGKSTLMMALLGLVECEGEILVDGVRVEKRTLSDIRRKLGFVMQDSDDQMFMPTVYEDMLFGPMNYGLSREEARAKTNAALDALGLQALKHRHNHRLSGGEKRMAAIATILAMEPAALLMDEPTSALDPYNRRRVIEIVHGLPQTRLIASHDLDMILDTCDRVLLLSDGRVAADGPADALLRDKALLEAHRLELPLSLGNRGMSEE